LNSESVQASQPDHPDQHDQADPPNTVLSLPEAQKN
jgi:hypothetical protein